MMRIERINIENFRCFKGLNRFDVDGKTIILYGENGYGKSSFFDAIEWCLTGTVDRFKQPGERNINKKIIVNRQAEEGETCSVELIIDEVKLKRTFRNVKGSRETILVKDLSNITIAQGKENVERYIEENIAYETANKKLLTTLIKKSHILSQDQITDFVLRDDPKGRFDSLADIMGYRQLMNLAKNLKKVKTEINRNISKQNQNISTYNNVIQSKQKEKIELNLIEINHMLEQLKINVNHEDILSEIKKKEEALVDSKGRLDEKLSNFKNLNYDIKSYSYNDLEVNSNNLQLQTENSDNKRKRIERLLDKVYEEDNQISKQLVNIDTQSNNLNEKIELEKKISIIESELNDFNILEENLEPLIKDAEKQQKEFFYVQTHLQSYLRIQEILKNNPILIDENKLYIEKYDKKISRYSKYLSNLESSLDNEKESTSLNKLNNAIQEVYSYVEKKNHHVDNKICPVCSSEKEDLSGSILNNIERNLFIIQQNSSKISKINEKIKIINQKVENLKNAKISAVNDLKNLETNLIISEKNLREIQNSNLYKSDIFENMRRLQVR
ncbi:AAA family ATPase [Virgibacillus flavescens]|uniref:AAA family ATPase n=1 Tax=Virgibacillus flavescens TaxID=1611422 RepID=UPI003D344414